jgi:hypothetical protein
MDEVARREAYFEDTDTPGRWLLNGGHVVLLRPDHPLANARGMVLEHRMVLYDAGIDPTGHDVHHKNGDKSDNRVENLELVDHAEHARRHITERRQQSSRRL